MKRRCRISDGSSDMFHDGKWTYAQISQHQQIQELDALCREFSLVDDIRPYLEISLWMRHDGYREFFANVATQLDTGIVKDEFKIVGLSTKRL
jgi:hypothetical protein